MTYRSEDFLNSSIGLSSVRLIVENQNGEFLFERKSVKLEGSRYLCGYWGLKEINGNVLPGELVTDAIKRVVQLRLGIEVAKLELLYKSSNRFPEQPTILMYLHITDWHGVLRDSCNPDILNVGKVRLRCRHSWISPCLFGSYIMRAQTVRVLDILEKRFRNSM